MELSAAIKKLRETLAPVTTSRRALFRAIVVFSCFSSAYATPSVAEMVSSEDVFTDQNWIVSRRDFENYDFSANTTNEFSQCVLDQKGGAQTVRFAVSVGKEEASFVIFDSASTENIDKRALIEWGGNNVLRRAKGTPEGAVLFDSREVTFEGKLFVANSSFNRLLADLVSTDVLELNVILEGSADAKYSFKLANASDAVKAFADCRDGNDGWF
jgi:hypothetical protein